MTANESDAATRLVGADRVLAVLLTLGEHPEGLSLEELARRLESPKSTVHRALAALRRSKLARLESRGVYCLGDEFYRIASLSLARHPESARVGPLLQALADRYRETAHYAVLDGGEVVYRAKVDPPEGAVRLTSTVGGRNPAYRTAVGKVLLAFTVDTFDDLRDRLGEKLERRTPNTITDIDVLWRELQETRTRGYAVDDQENEVGINCLAVPVTLDGTDRPTGGASVSAVAFRTPLSKLVAEAESIRAIADSAFGSR